MSDKQFDLKIEILDEKYTDQLIVALVQQGHEVYLGEDNNVYFQVYGCDMSELTYEKIKKD
jgi:hypothetical protein